MFASKEGRVGLLSFGVDVGPLLLLLPLVVSDRCVVKCRELLDVGPKNKSQVILMSGHVTRTQSRVRACKQQRTCKQANGGVRSEIVQSAA